jgi:hypothetical protein
MALLLVYTAASVSGSIPRIQALIHAVVTRGS